MRVHTKTGFSLVEVLVSLLILSLGIIGAASMQLTALRNSQQSAFHGIALRIAADIAEQIRAASANGIDDLGNPFLDLDFRAGASTQTVADSCFGIQSQCSSAMLQASQIHEFENRLQLMLPQGRIKICRDTAPWDSINNVYAWECETDRKNAPIAVKIGWREPAEGLSAAPQHVSRPRVVLLVKA